MLPLIVLPLKTPTRFPVENPTNTATASKLSKGSFFVRVRFGGFRVRLRRLSEYGSVACLVERPTQETQAEQYSDTVAVLDFLCDSESYWSCSLAANLHHRRGNDYLSKIGFQEFMRQF